MRSRSRGRARRLPEWVRAELAAASARVAANRVELADGWAGPGGQDEPADGMLGAAGQDTVTRAATAGEQVPALAQAADESRWIIPWT